MHIGDSLVEKLLRQAGVDDDKIAKLYEQAAQEKKALRDLALANNLITEAELTKLYAEEIEVPLAEFNPNDIDKAVLKTLPERMARQYRAVVFASDEKNDAKLVAMEDPDDVQARN